MATDDHEAVPPRREEDAAPSAAADRAPAAGWKASLSSVSGSLRDRHLPLWHATASRATGNIRANAVMARDFSRLRRREMRQNLRHAAVPYSASRIANAAALALSAILLLMLVLDPFSTPWQEQLPAPARAVFEVVTRTGTSGWILALTGGYVLWSLFHDMSAVHLRTRAQHWMRSATALYVFCAVAGSGLVTLVLKYVIGRARPVHFHEVGPYAFHVFSGTASWASFPSGHSTTAMALAVSLALLFPRLFSVFLCAGFWVAVSRIAVLSHYPSDVLSGCLVGGIFAWILARVFARRRHVFVFDEDGRLVPRHAILARIRRS